MQPRALFRQCSVDVVPRLQAQEKSFAHTAQVLRTMEAVAVAIGQRESTLLVGETGTGKSTLVQHIADQVRRFSAVLPIAALWWNDRMSWVCKARGTITKRTLWSISPVSGCRSAWWRQGDDEQPSNRCLIPSDEQTRLQFPEPLHHALMGHCFLTPLCSISGIY